VPMERNPKSASFQKKRGWEISRGKEKRKCPRGREKNIWETPARPEKETGSPKSGKGGKRTLRGINGSERAMEKSWSLDEGEKEKSYRKEDASSCEDKRGSRAEKTVTIRRGEKGVSYRPRGKKPLSIFTEKKGKEGRTPRASARPNLGGERQRGACCWGETANLRTKKKYKGPYLFGARPQKKTIYSRREKREAALARSVEPENNRR